MSKNNKPYSYRSLFIGVAIILMLGIGLYCIKSNPSLLKDFHFFSSQSRTEQSHEIIFAEKNTLYIKDLDTLQKKQIPIEGLSTAPMWLTMSPDKTYLYMNVGTDLLIYNFTNEKTNMLKDIGPNARPDVFSPNGKYAIIDTGCCPGNRGKILITVDGKILDKDYGTKVAWSPDSTAYALTKGDITISAVPTGPSPDTSSVYLKKITNETVTTEKIVTADYQTSYYAVSWEDTTMIHIEKLVFKKPFPKTVSNQQMNDAAFGDYWLKNYENPIKSSLTFSLLDKSSKQALAPKNDTPDPDPAISPDGKWKIEINLDPNNDGYVDGTEVAKIYISATHGSKKIEIGDGSEAIWK